MQDPQEHPANPALKELVVEASKALALLDAERLEELAVSCEALTRTLNSNDMQEDAEARRLVARQAREAQGDMAVFARVLEATRANLSVMKRLREIRAGRVEYTERELCGGRDPGSPSSVGSKNPERLSAVTEEDHGDD
jgi:hypothetical protein